MLGAIVLVRASNSLAVAARCGLSERSSPCSAARAGRARATDASATTADLRKACLRALMPDIVSLDGAFALLTPQAAQTFYEMIGFCHSLFFVIPAKAGTQRLQ